MGGRESRKFLKSHSFGLSFQLQVSHGKHFWNWKLGPGWVLLTKVWPRLWGVYIVPISSNYLTKASLPWLHGRANCHCISQGAKASPMFVEKKVCYSALLTNLVGWHAGAVSFPLSDVIFGPASLPPWVTSCFVYTGITNLSLHKHWTSLASF